MFIRSAIPHRPVVYQSHLLEQASLPHAFSTRQAGDGSSWDLAMLTRPDADQASGPSTLASGAMLLMQAAGCEGHKLVYLKQVHGRAVHVATQHVATQIDTASQTTPVIPEADALVTSQAGLALCIRVADCVPVLLAAMHENTVIAVAAAHGGWRGVVAGIVPQTLQTLRRVASEKAGVPGQSLRLLAAIGPCISNGHFEVGPEVAQAFSDAGLAPAITWPVGKAKPHVDMPGAVALQLQAQGVALADIDASGLCTYQQADDFFSHRRDQGRTGRLAAIIALPRQQPG